VEPKPFPQGFDMIEMNLWRFCSVLKG